MNNLFEAQQAVEILLRLSKLNPGSAPLWGKMNVSQMMAHCQVPIEVALGEKELKRTVIGFVFGGIAKKQIISDKPIKKSLPTDPSFIVKDDRDFFSEFQKLENQIKKFTESEPAKVAARSHPFFGKMSGEEWGVLNWKHLDHHLRQFGV